MPVPHVSPMPATCQFRSSSTPTTRQLHAVPCHFRAVPVPLLRQASSEAVQVPCQQQASSRPVPHRRQATSMPFPPMQTPLTCQFDSWLVTSECHAFSKRVRSICNVPPFTSCRIHRDVSIETLLTPQLLIKLCSQIYVEPRLRKTFTKKIHTYFPLKRAKPLAKPIQPRGSVC